REDISECDEIIKVRVLEEEQLDAENYDQIYKAKLQNTIRYAQSVPYIKKRAQEYYEEAVAYRESAQNSRLPSLARKLTVVSETSRILKFPAHTGRVNRISFRPNTQEFATCSTSKDVKIWPILNFVGSYSISQHGDHILGCEHSLDGRYLATASRDGKARIWDLDVREKGPRELYGHSERVTDVAFCPTNSVVATSSDDCTVRVWDLESDRDPLVLRKHNAWVRSVAFSACGELLVSSSADNTAVIWDWKNEIDRCTCIGHQGFVYEAAFVNEASEVVTGSLDGTVKFWNSTNGAEIQVEDAGAHLDAVTSLSATSDGSLLATGSSDGSVILWDPLSRRPTRQLVHPERSINAVRLSPDGRFLVTGSVERIDLAGPESHGEVSLWRL
ncbi:WD40 repeat domain-containing protein, partial [Rhodovulum sulfidophilum]|uniref:WD40 repeat domain-containing protein n=1 Tax=Rhodovulum sulfidophilum TaxID=35806 RepID=UPI0013898A85